MSKRQSRPKEKGRKGRKKHTPCDKILSIESASAKAPVAIFELTNMPVTLVYKRSEYG